MDIKQLYIGQQVDDLLTGFEAAIKLDGNDYSESNYDTIKQNVMKRINREYQLDLSIGKINDLAFEQGIYRVAAVSFIDSMALHHAKLSAYSQICRYRAYIDVSLQSINYMSYTEDSLMEILKLLQREKFQPRCDEAIESMKQKLMTIKTSREKRFFLLMLLCYDFGLYEVVASIAEILYLGGRYDS